MDPSDERHRDPVRAAEDDELAELEPLFEKARAHRPSEGTLAHLLRAVPRHTVAHRRLWKTAGALLATAAIVLIAVVTLIPPSQPRALALSQVAEAMRKAPIILGRCDRGYEVWRSPGQFYAIKHADLSEIKFLDAAKQESWTYAGGRNCIVVCTCESQHVLLDYQPAQTLEDLIQEIEAVGGSVDERWSRKDLETEDGPRIELTRKDDDPWSRKIVIDGRSGLIVRTESVQERISYSYPETGPRDIYDLGLPRDTRVVDGRASAELLDLRERVLAAMRRGFGAYRMIYIDTVGGLGLHHVVSDGRRCRCDNILLSQPTWALADLPEMARRYWDYDPSATAPKSVLLFDGEVETRMSFDEEGRPTRRSVCGAWGAASWTRTLEHLTWALRQGFGFFGDWGDRQDQFVGSDPLGRICYRSLGQANNISRPWLYERWYDPQHGYGLGLLRSQKFPEAPWQLDPSWQDEYVNDQTTCTLRTPVNAPAESHEWEVLEWAELRPGQWYPRLTQLRTLVQTQDGRWVARQPQTKVRYLLGGEILEYEKTEEEAKERVEPKYRYIQAEPLDEVNESWFELPEDWLEVPVTGF